MPQARSRHPGARTAAFTAAALVSFAANSWLCRGALRSGAIDPVTFTAVRVVAGALALALCLRLSSTARVLSAAGESGTSWGSALALFAYAIAFSLAYLRLDAGVGALVLFGTVQVTMLLGGVLGGLRPRGVDLAGMTISIAGLALLAAPGRTAPHPPALAGMALAGLAWGIYSLRGRGAARPLAANAGNFLRAALPALAAAALPALGPAVLPGYHVTGPGLALAAVSGAVTSGLGYAAWYAALPGLAPVRAGLVQLSVPVLAALGGVLLLGERPTLRLALSGALVLTGIALSILAPQPAPLPSPAPAPSAGEPS
jgi:drug/metabolite transporter (DMT)-like permease